MNDLRVSVANIEHLVVPILLAKKLKTKIGIKGKSMKVAQSKPNEMGELDVQVIFDTSEFCWFTVTQYDFELAQLAFDAGKEANWLRGTLTLVADTTIIRVGDKPTREAHNATQAKHQYTSRTPKKR